MLYRIAVTLAKPILYLLFRIKIINRQALCFDGAAIVCANHKHWSDPIFLAIATKRPLHFMAKKSLFQSGFLSWLFHALGCIPVNRDGSDIASTKRAIKYLSQQEALGIFPQGTRRDDLEGYKPGVAAIAVLSRATIIPVYIDVEFKLFGKILIHAGNAFKLEEYYGKKLSAQQYDHIAGNEIFQRIVDLKGS